MMAYQPDTDTLQGYDYAILNPLRIPPQSWDGLNVLSLTPKRYKAQAHLFPVLLSLSRFTDLDDVRQRRDSWQAQNDTPWFSALLVAPPPLDMTGLGRHLTQRMTLQLHTGASALLRYHDPNVFRHLTWLLDEEQLDALLGPVQAWSWPEHPQQWQTLERKRTHPSELVLRAEQEDTLARLATINSHLPRLEWIAPELDQSPLLAKRIDVLLAAAEGHGLEADEDRELFVEQALCYDPCLHHHPEMLARLRRAANGETTYRRACAPLDHEALWRLVIAQRATRT